MSDGWIQAPIPKKLGFFAEWGKYRYKVARGGRGSGKSRTIATVLAARGAQVPLRWFCARETQKSLKFSSKQLIVDAILRLGLSDQYRILDDEIRGTTVYPDGRFTVFIFAGIREMNEDSIKSLEDFDGIWLAEAHDISESSWNKITPTFRKDNAEIWVDYNPQFEEDYIHRWCADPPPNSMVVHVNYQDNPWFPKNLQADMEHMQRVAPETYRHVWLGEARNNVVGAVYAKEMEAAQAEGRIVLAPGIGIDHTKPIDTYWDLGHGDPMAIWFAQSVSGWWNVIDFYQNDGEAIEHYVSVIQSRGYNLGTFWLPWDGIDAQLHHRLTGSNQRSPEQVLRSMGIKVRIAPKTSIDSGIASVRTIFPQLRFNEPKCHEGIMALRRYQWGEPKKDGDSVLVQAKPRHDQYSHPADALKTLASAAREPRAPAKAPTRPPLRQASAFS